MKSLTAKVSRSLNALALIGERKKERMHTCVPYEREREERERERKRIRSREEDPNKRMSRVV